jgi:NAD(P)-dependent dehydrogenase (short-subunit alcohol dehydrogenase family)
LVAAGLGAWFVLRALGRRQPYDLRGKNVLVTGGSRGLGLVLARELLREGANVVICARDQAELDRAFDDLATRAGGSRILAVPCDVTQRPQVEAAVREVLSRWERIDVLINNAGTISVGPVDTMTLDDYEQAMQVHYWGPLYLTLAVLPGMRLRREGRIVNVSSIGGKIGVPHLVPYDASKFALVGLSEGLRAELAQDGIVVTTVCPGLMRTGSPRNAFFKGRHRQEYAWFKIGDSLPFFSMSAEQAARQIIHACKQGDAEVVLTIPAKLAVTFRDLFPGLTADLLSLVNRWLPRSGGIGAGKVQGKDSESGLAPGWLTTLTDRAAQRNNEVDPSEFHGWNPTRRFHDSDF